MKSKVKDGIVIGLLSAIALVFLTVILVDFSVVFFSLGDIFSYLPSRAIYRAFPEYDVAEEDVECVEIGIRSDSGEYRIRTLSEEETKTYLKNFREARVRVKWTDTVKMFFKCQIFLGNFRNIKSKQRKQRVRKQDDREFLGRPSLLILS